MVYELVDDRSRLTFLWISLTTVLTFIRYTQSIVIHRVSRFPWRCITIPTISILRDLLSSSYCLASPLSFSPHPTISTRPRAFECPVGPEHRGLASAPPIPSATCAIGTVRHHRGGRWQGAERMSLSFLVIRSKLFAWNLSQLPLPAPHCLFDVVNPLSCLPWDLRSFVISAVLNVAVASSSHDR